MGAGLNRATRFLRMYNIENRVDKVLLKDKPTVSPRFSADQKQLESNESANSIASGGIHEKNEQLLDHLRDVKVISTGDNPSLRRLGDSKLDPKIPPPLNRLQEPSNEISVDAAFGYVEPKRVPPGRVSLRQFLAYLQQHGDSPEEYSIERFVDMYSIKPEVAQKLFKNHRLLALQEFPRQQSRAPPRPPHIAVAEVIGIEAEARRKPGQETGFTSKY